MAKGTLVKRSEEEILDQASRIIAGTINPEEMGISPEEVDVDNFIKYFKEMLSQLLSHKDAVYLAIGTYINADRTGVYSLDIQFILEGVESKMNTKFYFYHGIALWLCKNELYAWFPQ